MDLVVADNDDKNYGLELPFVCCWHCVKERC